MSLSFQFIRVLRLSFNVNFCYYFIQIVSAFLPSGSNTTMRHKAQITHMTQNNKPHLNKTQHTKLHKKYRTHYTKFCFTNQDNRLIRMTPHPLPPITPDLRGFIVIEPDI
jgi:hypothetical protein